MLIAKLDEVDIFIVVPQIITQGFSSKVNQPIVKFTDDLSVISKQLLYLVGDKRILDFVILCQLLLDNVMVCVKILSLVFVMDTDFYIVRSIGFLVVLKHLGANGCHNSFELPRKNFRNVFVTVLREVQQKTMQITPFRGIRSGVGHMLLKCLNKRKKPFFLAKKRLLRKCAHLGSNQGPKDYESSTLTN